MDEFTLQPPPSAVTRRCWHCRTFKPLDEFVKTRRLPSGKGYCCRECNRGHTTRWRRKKLGVDNDTYNRMVAAQDNKCAICNRSDGKALHLDHCHKTDTARGLLCGRCNRALGFMDDDIERLKAAIEYLSGNSTAALY